VLVKLLITFLAGQNEYINIQEYTVGKLFFFIRFHDGQTISLPREDLTSVERIYDDKRKIIHLKQFKQKELTW
jgi:hypothetical protein